MKKVSWHWTGLPLEGAVPQMESKALHKAVSRRGVAGALPSLAPSRNCRANFETDARPCLDAST